MEKILVSIITVGMNHLNYIKDLYYSIYYNKESKPKIQFESIYVDNCSTDGSVEYIKSNFPDVKIICNNKILGFGENNNKGFKHANGKFIAIINPDIIFQKQSFDNAITYLIENSKIGILVPKLLNPDLTIQYSVRGFINPLFFVSRVFTNGNDNSKNAFVERYLCKNLEFDKIQYINWAFGAAMFIRKDTYEKLNGFDESYFLYMEDEDLCLRSWKLNLPVIYNPNSVFIHNHLRGSSKISKKTIMHTKSLVIFFFKHGLFVKNIDFQRYYPKLENSI